MEEFDRGALHQFENVETDKNAGFAIDLVREGGVHLENAVTGIDHAGRRSREHRQSEVRRVEKSGRTHPRGAPVNVTASFVYRSLG